MATYIERAPVAYERSDNSAVSFVIGLVVLLAVLFLLFYYGIPALRGSVGTPQINVPGQIDVNVNTPNQPNNAPAQHPAPQP